METLGPDIYLKRLEAAQASLGRVLIGLLALTAFWLTIDFEYLNFAGIHHSYEQLTLRENRANAQLAQLKIAKASNKQSAQTKKEIEKIKDDKNKLEAHPLKLSILGTDLPSNIWLAPQMWLAALLLTLLFLMNSRNMVFRNLAAISQTLPPGPTSFGYAGDGSPFLAPLPKRFERHTDQGSTLVLREELAKLLGWSPGMERQAFRMTLLFAGIFLAMAIHVTYVAYITSDSISRAAGFIDPGWYLVGWPIAATLFAGVLLVVGMMFAPGFFYEREQISGRRAILASGGAALGAAALLPVAYRVTTLFGHWQTKLIPPRRHKKRARVASGLQPNRLAIASGRPGHASRRVHWVESDGSIRLSCESGWPAHFRALRLLRVNQTQALQFMTGVDGKPFAPAGATAAFERAALVLLQSGKRLDAIDCLLLACQLDGREFYRGFNIRLYDLTTGLVLRYRSEAGVEARRVALAGAFDEVLHLGAALARQSDPGPVGRPQRHYARLRTLRDLLDKPDSRWAKRWLDRTKPRRWSMPVGVPTSARRGQTLAWYIDLD